MPAVRRCVPYVPVGIFAGGAKRARSCIPRITRSGGWKPCSSFSSSIDPSSSSADRSASTGLCRGWHSYRSRSLRPWPVRGSTVSLQAGLTERDRWVLGGLRVAVIAVVAAVPGPTGAGCVARHRTAERRWHRGRRFTQHAHRGPRIGGARRLRPRGLRETPTARCSRRCAEKFQLRFFRASGAGGRFGTARARRHSTDRALTSRLRCCAQKRSWLAHRWRGWS